MVARFKAGESISALSRDYDVSRASVMRVVKPIVSADAWLSKTVTPVAAVAQKGRTFVAQRDQALSSW